jgi:hypothetical protein
MPSPLASVEENARRVKAIKEDLVRDIKELVADESTRNMLIGEIKSGAVTSRGIAAYIKSREDAKTRERLFGKEEAPPPIKPKLKGIGTKYKPLSASEARGASKRAAQMTAGQVGTLQKKHKELIQLPPNS